MTTSNFGKDHDSGEEDVIYLDLSDAKYLGLNPLSTSEPNNPVAVQEVVDRFKMLWNIGNDTPRLENILRASLETLAINKLTLAEMPLLLRDKEFRKGCINTIPVTLETEGLRQFWLFLIRLITSEPVFDTGSSRGRQTVSPHWLRFALPPCVLKHARK